MNAGFTPGPWEVERCGTTYYNGPSDAGEPFVITAPNNGVILAVAVPDVVPAVEANANLIATAPELYEALKTAARRFRAYEQVHRAKGTDDGYLKADNNSDLAIYCERALAKARGEQVPE